MSTEMVPYRNNFDGALARIQDLEEQLQFKKEETANLQKRIETPCKACAYRTTPMRQAVKIAAAALVAGPAIGLIGALADRVASPWNVPLIIFTLLASVATVFLLIVWSSTKKYE